MEYYCEILSSFNNIDELECIQMRTSFHDDECDLIGEMNAMIDAACGAYMNHADNDIANAIIDVIMRELDSSPFDLFIE